MTNVTIRFIPQAWVNDYAVRVDPSGPTEFEVPAEDAQDAEGNRLPDHDYESDVLRAHPNAPEWIREWSGPFEIEVGPFEIEVIPTPRERLEYLRTQLRAECISYGELGELQDLAEHIEPGDVELLEAAGVPEFPDN